MTPNGSRPFFSNFLAAFRAHSAIQKAATFSPSPTTPQSNYHTSNATSTSTTTTSTSSTLGPSSNPRSIQSKTSQHTSSSLAALQQTPSNNNASTFQQTRQHSTSPYSRSPGGHHSPISPSSHTHTHHATTQTTPSYFASSNQRRGSDSSSEGFREAMGAEKWYIGGRTERGEERYFKLGVVKRPRSLERMSVDRMSL